MDLKERKILTEIERLHNKLNNIILLKCGDKKYFEIQEKYTLYHNSVNFEILIMETEKRKEMANQRDDVSIISGLPIEVLIRIGEIAKVHGK